MTIKVQDGGTFGLHIIRAPSSRYIFVGSVPAALCDEHGNSPAFNTPDAALAFARSHTIGTIQQTERWEKEKDARIDSKGEE
jgi:hypothetical protein